MDCSRARRENLEDRAATWCPAGPRRSQMLLPLATRKTIPPNACSDCNRELRRERDFHRASVPSGLLRNREGASWNVSRSLNPLSLERIRPFVLHGHVGNFTGFGV